MNLLREPVTRWELLEEGEESDAEESDAKSECQPSPGGDGDKTSALVEVPQIELPEYLPMPPSMRGHCSPERWVWRDRDRGLEDLSFTF